MTHGMLFAYFVRIRPLDIPGSIAGATSPTRFRARLRKRRLVSGIPSRIPSASFDLLILFCRCSPRCSLSSHSLSQSGQSGPSTKFGPLSIRDHCCNIASRDGSFSSVAISSRIETTTSPSDSLYCVYCLLSTSLRGRSAFEGCAMLLLIYSGDCCCSIFQLCSGDKTKTSLRWLITLSAYSEQAGY